MEEFDGNELFKYPITGHVNNNRVLKELPNIDNLESKKTVIYMIDSRDRNTDIYPDPSNYEIELNDEFNNVKELELLSIQMSDYVYSINNNKDQGQISFFQLQNNSTPYLYHDTKG